MRNLHDQQVGLTQAITSIEKRLPVPVSDGHGRRQAARFQKQRRLQVLKAGLAELEARLAAPRGQRDQGWT